MLTIATCLWNPNQHTRHFSRCYDESWADKLYRGFARNLTVPWRMVVLTDRPRRFQEGGIEQQPIKTLTPHYGVMIECFRLDCPMIVVGLDTIVTGNCDALAEYCLTAAKPAVPNDPFYPAAPWKLTNAVVLAPQGCKAMLYDAWAGENDMDYINTRDVAVIDEVLPGQVRSYKGHVQHHGVDDERLIFFHGPHKPHELPHVGWIHRNWHALLKDEAAA